MRKFETEQKIVDIAGTLIGGQPGEYPTALMGAIFYAGDKLVAETNSPEFDREKAKEVIELAQNMSQQVGTSLVLDIICATPEQARNFIGFGLDEFDLPILMDGTTFDVRMAGLEAAKERGAEYRMIYNAIQPTVSDEELEKVIRMGFSNAIVMLINQRDPTAKGKIKIARELVPRAQNAGFKDLLVDLAVLDVIDVGTCSVAMREIKEEFGWPCGCSPTHTHRTRWKKANQFTEKEQAAAKVSTATMLQVVGGDFFMYDIKQREIIPAMAMVDAEIAYGAMSWKSRPKSRSHPLYNVF